MWSFRQPSPVMRLLRWHRSYMRGENPPRHDGDPQCGWYRMQKVKGGPWVPVEIWCEQVTDETGELCQPERMRADAFGENLDAEEIWTWLTPISRQEFDRITQFRLQNEHRYESGQRIDLGAAPTLP